LAEPSIVAAASFEVRPPHKLSDTSGNGIVANENVHNVPAKKKKVKRCMYGSKCRNLIAGRKCKFLHPDVDTTSLQESAGGNHQKVVATDNNKQSSKNECQKITHESGGKSSNRDDLPSPPDQQDETAVSAKKKTKQCRFKDRCRNPKCKFLHPTAAICPKVDDGSAKTKDNKGSNPSRKGNDNATQAPLPPTVVQQKSSKSDKPSKSKNKMCRFGGRCKNPNCQFSHPQKGNSDSLPIPISKRSGICHPAVDEGKNKSEEVILDELWNHLDNSRETKTSRFPISSYGAPTGIQPHEDPNVARMRLLREQKLAERLQREEKVRIAKRQAMLHARSLNQRKSQNELENTTTTEATTEYGRVSVENKHMLKQRLDREREVKIELQRRKEEADIQRQELAKARALEEVKEAERQKLERERERLKREVQNREAALRKKLLERERKEAERRQKLELERIKEQQMERQRIENERNDAIARSREEKKATKLKKQEERRQEELQRQREKENEERRVKEEAKASAKRFAEEQAQKAIELENQKKLWAKKLMEQREAARLKKEKEKEKRSNKAKLLVEERRKFWESDQKEREEYLHCMKKFCCSEILRKNEKGVKTKNVESDFAELEQLVAETYDPLFPEKSWSKVEVADPKNKALDGRNGKILGWNKTKEKYKIGLVTKKQKVEEVYVKPENLVIPSNTSDKRQPKGAKESVTVEISSCSVNFTKSLVESMIFSYREDESSLDKKILKIMADRNKSEREENKRRERAQKQQDNAEKANKEKKERRRREREAEQAAWDRDEASRARERAYRARERREERQEQRRYRRGGDPFGGDDFPSMRFGIGPDGIPFVFVGGGRSGGFGGFGGASFMFDDDDDDDDYYYHDDGSVEENESMEEHAEVLGISADASANEIRSAFKRKALKLHPDKYRGEENHNGMTKEQVEEEFKRCNAAHEYLMKQHED
jgi:hypothetical protein